MFQTDAFIPALLDFSIRAAILGGTVQLLLTILRVGSGAVRHGSWTAVLLALFLLPAARPFVPSMDVPLRLLSVERQWAGENAGDVSFFETRLALLAGMNQPSAVAAPEDGAALPQTSRPWNRTILFLYGAGASIFLARFLVGWLAAVRLSRRAARVSLGKATCIYESAEAEAPVAIGVLRPRILLPPNWRTWTTSKRAAILAHEMCHVRRHDPRIAFLAHLFCCLLWFHPMAWWLKSRLAAEAEHAADDEAARTLGDARVYASILLEIARTSGGRRSRLSWLGASAHGSLLSARIDRLVGESAMTPLPRARKAALIIGAGVAVCVTAACGARWLPTAAEERQALERVEAGRMRRALEAAEQNALMDALAAGPRIAEQLSPADARLLERKLNADPGDLETRKRLLFFYSAAPVDPSARWRHVSYLVANHPEDELAGTAATAPLDDAERGALHGLWLQHVNAPDASLRVLRNASRFFETHDRAAAETILLRAMEIQPGEEWSRRLAKVYALTLLGATSVAPFYINDYAGNLKILSRSPEAAQDDAAGEVRQKLDETSDDALLFHTAQYLNVLTGRSSDPNALLLATRYYIRAARLNPRSPAQDWLAMSRSGERRSRLLNLPDGDDKMAAALALPPRARFELLWELADLAASQGGNLYFNDETRKYLDRAAAYSAALLEVAPQFRSDPEYGVALFNAHVMLGFAASSNGDRASAMRHLRDAADAPGFKGPSYSLSAPWKQLCSAALDYKEFALVVHFLERLAQFDPGSADAALSALAELRGGKMPGWYRASDSR